MLSCGTNNARKSERQKAIENYDFQVKLRQNSCEKAFFQQFDEHLLAHRPLAAQDRLIGSHITFPISFIYGEFDWMCSRGSRQIVRANRHFGDGSC